MELSSLRMAMSLQLARKRMLRWGLRVKFYEEDGDVSGLQEWVKEWEKKERGTDKIRRLAVYNSGCGMLHDK